MTHHDTSIERLRDTATDSPAGPLFAGTHAEADIVALDDAPTVRCGSICTGTVPIVCC